MQLFKFFWYSLTIDEIQISHKNNMEAQDNPKVDDKIVLMSVDEEHNISIDYDCAIMSKWMKLILSSFFSLAMSLFHH